MQNEEFDAELHPNPPWFIQIHDHTLYWKQVNCRHDRTAPRADKTKWTTKTYMPVYRSHFLQTQTKTKSKTKIMKMAVTRQRQPLVG